MYCTLDDLKKSLPESEILQLGANEQGEIDAAVVDESILSASALIDGFLPVAVEDHVPQIIKQCAVDLTIYYLHKRQMGTELPESIDKSYSRVLKLLGMIQEGKINLGIPVSDGEDSGGTFFKTNKSGNKTFGDDVWERY